MRTSRLAPVSYCLLALLASCTDDRSSTEEDLLPADATAADQVSADTALTDLADDDAEQLLPDIAEPDCTNAYDGGPCTIEGASCVSCGPTSCSVCNILNCSAGIWSRLESPPGPQCHTEVCSPLETDTCGSRESCYFEESLRVFRCLPTGTLDEEMPCNDTRDCVRGHLCLTRPGTETRSCLRVCDPRADDGACEGRCEQMGVHGFENGAGHDIEDIGLCIF